MLGGDIFEGLRFLTMSTILLQKFANREIRLGCQSICIAQKKRGDKSADFNNLKFSQKVLDLEVSHANLNGGYELGHDPSGRAIAIPYTQEKHIALKRHLDIISEFQCRSLKVQNKGGWGFKPRETAFTKNARHRLLEAGAVMDKLHQKNVAELTCTIPGSTSEAFRTVADWSGWIVNRLLQTLRNRKQNCSWFYVWERQKRGALHIHFAIGSSTLTEAVLLASQLECKWFDLLLELKDKTNVDTFKKDECWTWRNLPQNWQSHVAPIYKSVAAYFSKYAGKSSNSANSGGAEYFPARWWGSSTSIKRGIENERAKISIEVSLPNVQEAVTFLQDFISKSSPIRQYKYNFHLGTSRSGANLGGGWREIYYFDDVDFANITEYLDVLAEYVAQRWGVYADIPVMSAQTSKITYKGGMQI